MRTSRLSRETARVVNALSPSRRTAGARRSLRAFAHGSSIAPKSPQSIKDESDDSDLSEPPSSIDGGNGSVSTRKRKRDDTSLTPATSTTSDLASIRRSPRKAPKLEDEPTKRKAKRQPAKKIKQEDGEVIVQPPANWEEVYNVTAEMRKKVLAPVDTMGCETLAEKNRSPRDMRLQTLVALMLSSQTKDTVTAVAMKQLQEGLEGGFNLEALLAVTPEKLNGMINKVGFHNNKTKFIKSVAVILEEQYAGDIPDTIEGLVSLPGVGPKMAYLCMSAAWGRTEGIGVDVHVHRITNLWGWHKTSTPEQTRAELEAWLPREKWHDINHLLVGFGQTYCPPVGRRCDDCELSVRKLCPSAVVGSPKKRKVVKKEVKVEKGVVVKDEEKIVEADDVAVTVQVKSEDGGEAQMEGRRMADIEDFA